MKRSRSSQAPVYTAVKRYLRKSSFPNSHPPLPLLIIHSARCWKLPQQEDIERPAAEKRPNYQRIISIQPTKLFIKNKQWNLCHLTRKHHCRQHDDEPDVPALPSQFCKWVSNQRCRKYGSDHIQTGDDQRVSRICQKWHRSQRFRIIGKNEFFGQKFCLTISMLSFNDVIIIHKNGMKNNVPNAISKIYTRIFIASFFPFSSVSPALHPYIRVSVSFPLSQHPLFLLSQNRFFFYYVLLFLIHTL